MQYKVVLDRNERKKMEEGKSNGRNRSCFISIFMCVCAFNINKTKKNGNNFSLLRQKMREKKIDCSAKINTYVLTERERERKSKLKNTLLCYMTKFIKSS